MPSHRPKYRSQHHSQPQPSDYETDTPAQAISAPAQRSNEELNLRVIRRHYPQVVLIIHVTPYAVLYTMTKEAQKWDKENFDVQGALFTCQLTPSSSGDERYAVIILNRHGLTNFYMEITSGEEVEVQDEFIICAANDQNIVAYGLWIHAESATSSTANARAETSAIIQAIAQKARANRESAESLLENGQSEAEPAGESVPMGRQLSLRELFGHQREEDAGFSVHSHGHVGSIAQPSQQIQSAPSSQNVQNAWAEPPPVQNDVLSQLFMKAKQDYNGVG